PEVLVRSTNLAFSHRTVTLLSPPGNPWLTVLPVRAAQSSVWIGLTTGGELFRVDLDAERLELLTRLTPDEVDFGQPISLHVDDRGRFAAVANTLGLRGLVLDLGTGARSMSLLRRDYHPEHCRFPLAFFEHAGRTLLVHATDWNRLDISDPRSGTRLTQRPVVAWRAGEPKPLHMLDYFHSDLLVSPDSRWIVDNGWVWHPCGEVVTWSLDQWVAQSEWESEDGPSRRSLCSREYFWNGPLCWVDGTTVAVWGFGDAEEYLIDAVRLFDVTTGRQLKWFAGPHGRLVVDEVLFAYGPEGGTSVWDIATGERLHHDERFCPSAYHPGARHFMTVLEDGRFQISRLR
ncbi:MAG TPA: hypothetical protein VNT75_00925, partial [Symbiobacteriaceae bacterium]|nr:hypothetical protein [Symbiobacteriaceae bacterium]